MATSKSPEQVIADKCAERRISYAALSRRLGKNHSYIHTFISQGSPEVLPEEVRRKVALILGVSEASLRPTLRGSPVEIIEVAIKDRDMAPAFSEGDVVFAETGQPHPGDFVVYDSEDGGETSVWCVNSIDMNGVELSKLKTKKTFRWTPEKGELYRVRQVNYA